VRGADQVEDHVDATPSGQLLHALLELLFLIVDPVPRAELLAARELPGRGPKDG
jgi:hypothetical protein